MKKTITVAEAFDKLCNLETMKQYLFINEYQAERRDSYYNGAINTMNEVSMFINEIEPLLDPQSLSVNVISKIRCNIQKMKHLYSPNNFSNEDVDVFGGALYHNCVELKELLSDNELFNKKCSIEYSEQILSNGIPYESIESFTIES